MHKKGCLLLHGFTGGPYEVQPLADDLQRSGFVCRVPVLPGHGNERALLQNVSWQDWLKASRREADQMAKDFGTFDLIGFSMGGLLAAYLANRYPVRKLVLLNAAYIYISPGRWLSETAANIRNRNWSQFRTIQSTPLRATWQFMRLVRSLKREISRIPIPVMIVQGGRDSVVHPYSARFVQRNLTSPNELHVFPNSGHMICLDVEAAEVINSVKRFLLKNN